MLAIRYAKHFLILVLGRVIPLRNYSFHSVISPPPASIVVIEMFSKKRHCKGTVGGSKRLTHLRQLEAKVSTLSVKWQRNSLSGHAVLIGKDSSVMLHLARKAFYPGTLPFPPLHVDTGWKFREMYASRSYRQRKAAASCWYIKKSGRRGDGHQSVRSR